MPQQAQGLLAARDKAILTLLYATGMRASEIAGLGANDVNGSLGVVRVLGKGSKERIVPLAKQAVAAVGEYIEQCRQHLPQGQDKGGCFFRGRASRLPARTFSAWFASTSGESACAAT